MLYARHPVPIQKFGPGNAYDPVTDSWRPIAEDGNRGIRLASKLFHAVVEKRGRSGGSYMIKCTGKFQSWWSCHFMASLTAELNKSHPIINQRPDRITPMFIAKNLTHFKTLFINQTKNMLSDDELGAFILVLANSLQDEFLKAELADDLRENFAALQRKFINGELNAAKDDIEVFEKLLEFDLADLPVWQRRSIGYWEVSLNSLRRLRPARASGQKFTSIRQAFDDGKFHFNKPFLDPEILWQGEYRNLQVKVLYNKFPFADFHLLVVISPEENNPQLLTTQKHDYTFSLVSETAEALPGFGMGYNSLAAGASVNHFHLQGFIRQQDFAIEKSHWTHHGGNVDYPLTVGCFSDSESSWDYIEQLTEKDMAFNCLYRENHCYVIPRIYQGSSEVPQWLKGAGWIDMAGAVTVSDQHTFENIDEQSVADALSLFTEIQI